MTKKALLINEIENLPEPLFDDLLQYIEFLKSKISNEKFESVLASESSLAKDWNKKEEDEAWQNL